MRGASRAADGQIVAQLRQHGGAEVEFDTLIDHLTAAMGLGDKSRSTGGTAEQARSAVTHRIRAAIRQIDKTNPALGRHLRHAINTGTYGGYRPELPTDWHIG